MGQAKYDKKDSRKKGKNNKIDYNCKHYWDYKYFNFREKESVYVCVHCGKYLYV